MTSGGKAATCTSRIHRHFVKAEHLRDRSEMIAALQAMNPPVVIDAHAEAAIAVEAQAAPAQIPPTHHAVLLDGAEQPHEALEVGVHLRS